MNTNALITAINANPGMEVDQFCLIEKAVVGEIVRLVSKAGKIGKQEWVKGRYCPINKGYMLTAFDDMNKEKKLTKGAVVNVGFDF